MKYVIGIDLGTSSVKVLLINQHGEVWDEVSKTYPLIQKKSGYSEQNPEQWVIQTRSALSQLVQNFQGDVRNIEGISFAGQMDGLVLLDESYHVIRDAILWNDTRTSLQCTQICEIVGEERLLSITKKLPAEGFTLPQLLWVREHEPEQFARAKVFLLPKDYLRYRMVGAIHTDYSDASATLLLDIGRKQWSEEICRLFHLSMELCPPLVDSHTCVGTLSHEFASGTGLSEMTKVFAGGADNACGAVGAGILSEGKTLCSIGTSGVVVSYEANSETDYEGKVHYFNHAKENAYYTMGAVLSAGYSLSWFKNQFASEESFESLLQDLGRVPIGANGLLFTPYLVGERTPYACSIIRGSFIGIDATTSRADFVRAVIEGITYALNESIEILRSKGKRIDTVISIGGGTKNEEWLQMQADVFNATVVKLENEQGPALGAAMLAAYGCGWFDSLETCASVFIKYAKLYKPKPENVHKYHEVYKIYQTVYQQTKLINEQLKAFRK
ncbi:xylulokinase [Fodinisporobacter ferrooxydans]|uniref:Xylulose kinase n=1 Tax=Fodinisporobacter ferrooxydans TaxID=2901836 RepID=A0ABY4CIT6_9BACL|nr:xylulokinase [Alicyclobacillaceae bacterium MYW30-H2]